MNEAKAKNEVVYKALKTDIINGAYPLDFHLDKEMLRHRYGFSTTPINFALVRLFNEGLLEKRGRDGFYTCKNTAITELKEIYLSTGVILKVSVAEFFTNCPNVPLSFTLDNTNDVVTNTEQVFEAIAGLMGKFRFYSIIRGNNDRLHLMRARKAQLIGSREQELAQLVSTLEQRDLTTWYALVDSYIARRLAVLTELNRLTEQFFRTS
jgi:hypothetical protein